MPLISDRKLIVFSLRYGVRNNSSEAVLLVQYRLTLQLLWILSHLRLQSINLFLYLSLFGIQVFLARVLIHVVGRNACESAHAWDLTVCCLIQISCWTLWGLWAGTVLVWACFSCEFGDFCQVLPDLLLLLLECHFLLNLFCLLGVLLLILHKILFGWRLWSACVNSSLRVYRRTCSHHILYLLLCWPFWDSSWRSLLAGTAKTCQHLLLQSILLSHDFAEGCRGCSDWWNRISWRRRLRVATGQTLLLVVDARIGPIPSSSYELIIWHLRRGKSAGQRRLISIIAEYLLRRILEQSRLPTLNLSMTARNLVWSHGEPVASLVLVWCGLTVRNGWLSWRIKWVVRFVRCLLHTHCLAQGIHWLIVLAGWLERALWTPSFVGELAFHACRFYFDFSDSFWLVGAVRVCIVIWILALLPCGWEWAATRLPSVLWRSLAWVVIFVVRRWILLIRLMLALRILCLDVLWALLFLAWTLLVKVLSLCEEEAVVSSRALIHLLFTGLNCQLLRWTIQIRSWCKLQLPECVRSTLYLQSLELQPQWFVLLLQLLDMANFLSHALQPWVLLLQDQELLMNVKNSSFSIEI